MTKTTHTPGPWRIGPMHKAILPEQNKNGGFAVCHLYGKDIPDNARLIAAAPDLLDAAEAAYAYINERCEATFENGSILGKLAAAIAKAEGRS